MSRFEIRKDGYYLDGKPYRVLSGAMHYFRVPREYWRDRILRLKACGFNTVETYIAWNAHEMTEGQYDFTGMLDVAAYLKLIGELGMHAIVRPGPYICSEWDFGGLPWWLLKKPGIRLRCMNDAYLAAVNRFFDHLMPILAPLQITRGGPILMMQVENEYGSYGDDHEYMRAMRDGILRRGIDVPLFTADGGADFMLSGGMTEDVFATVNFGSRAKQEFAQLRKRQAEGPLMCSEFWCGWFDHWTEEHHMRPLDDAVEALREELEAAGNVSVYMAHGGTNFGFMNGANGYECYEPTVNSYDDDAPVNEWGGLTEKYWAYRKLLRAYTDMPEMDPPAPLPRKRYGEVRFTKSAKLFDNLDALSTPVRCAYPLTMEELDTGYGFVLYTAKVNGPREELPVVLQDVHDRAHIFADEKLLGIQYRNDKEPAVKLAVPEEGCRLRVLVENMGRVNYGYHMMDKKGITEGIRLGQAFLFSWEMRPLPLTDLSRVAFEDGVPAFDGCPVFRNGTLRVDGAPEDTFVKLPGFGKGVIFVNGRVLSRYWNVGPQRSAYLPAPFLKEGDNEIIVLELDGFDSPAAILDDTDDLG